MFLHELITRPEQIVIDLQATDRWSAIDELITVLIETAEIPTDAAAAVGVAVREREQTMSTGIGHGIGIPHAPTDHVDRVEAVLGIARHAVDFSALDDQPVYIILLFVVPKEQFQEHLNTLANIARVLSDGDTRQRLRAAASATDVLAIIDEVDR